MGYKNVIITSILAWLGTVGILAQSDMQTKTHEIQEVVVTGTGTKHLLKNAPVQTEVISRKQLEAYGGKSIQDILSGLSASFDFNEGDMGSQMQLNGLGNSYILILVDGKRIHGDVGGENDLGLIDPHNIDHIEIVKGAQSALYGSDAIAGVVNIITRSPLTPQGGKSVNGIAVENSTRYGTYNDVRQHNGLGLRFGRLQSYTNFQLQHTDGWQNNSFEEAEGKLFTDSHNKTVNKYTNWQVAERLTYDFSKRLSMYADGMMYWKRIYRPQDGTHASFDVYTYDLMYRNSSASLGGRYSLSKTDYVTLDIDWNRHAYYYQYTATTLEDGYDIHGNPDPTSIYEFPFFAGQTNLQSDQQRVMAQLKGVFTLPFGNRLSAGMEYRYDYLKAPTRTAKGSCDDWTGALYVQDEYQPLTWLNITAGLRLNENAAFGFKATPKISCMASVGDFRFRAGWSQGFKTPTTKEQHYRYVRMMGAKTFFYMGNENLKAQSSDYFSANVEYRTDRFNVSVSGYLNKVYDMITLVNTTLAEIPEGVTSAYFGDGSGMVTPRMYKNMEDARTFGADVNVNWNITKELTLGMNYSYLDTKAHTYDADHSKLVEVTIDGMAHHKGTVHCNYNHRFTEAYALGVGVYGRMSSKRYYQNDGDGKAYQLWRLTTTHDIGHFKTMTYSMEAGVDNIFNYKDPAYHGYHLGTTSGGRTFYVGVNIRFNQGKKIVNKQNKTRSKQEQNDED